MNRWKSSRVLIALLAVVMASGPIPARWASAGPSNPATLLSDPDNPHNMSNWSSGAVRGDTDQVCIFCHTPHAASPDGALWARPDPSGTFSLYGGDLAIKDSAVFGTSGIKAAAVYYTTGESGAPVGHIYPNGASRLCMSCHDGVTAIGILNDGSSIAMSGANVDGDGSLRTGISSIIDLSMTHPISFVYSTTVAAQIDAAYDSRFGADNYFRGPGAFDVNVKTPLDSQSRMQCTTCHDPHYANHLGAAVPPFWQSSSYDATCAQCHTGTAYSNPRGPVWATGNDHNPGPGWN